MVHFADAVATALLQQKFMHSEIIADRISGNVPKLAKKAESRLYCQGVRTYRTNDE